MTQANLNAYALSKGINKTVQEMTQAEQVQLRYNYVMEMTKNAHGDFERTAGGTANKARVMTETFKELTTSLVQGLMPTVNKLLSIGIQVLNWFNNLSPTTKNFITYTLLLVAALGPLVKIYSTLITLKAILVGWYKAATIAKIMHTAAVNKETAATMAETAAKNASILTMIKSVALYVAQKVAIVASTVAITAYTIATKLAAAAMWLLNAAFVASPIGWIILGIGAIVGVFILLWKKLEGFRQFWINLWEGIKIVFKTVINYLIDGINLYLDYLRFMINGAITLINGFIKGLNKIPGVDIKLIPKLDENALQIPKLAKGGIAYGNAIVNVGEYSNARTNPEIIAPLDKLQSLIGDREQTININLDGRTVAQIVLDRSGRLIKQIGGV